MAKTKKLSKGGKIALSVVGGLLAVILLFATVMFIWVYADLEENEENALANQRQHVATLESAYANGTAPKLDQSKFVSPEVLSNLDTIKYNEVQFLATHNSYKIKEAYTSASIMNGVLSSFAGNGTTGYAYYFESLTDQFNSGILSIELDAYPMDDGSFRIAHHAVLDVNSSAIDFKTALQEIKMWSDYNEGHLPITILVEPKSWTGITRSDGHEFSLDDYKNFDSIIREVMGDTLVTPNDFLHNFGGDYATFEELRNADGWATLNQLLGKVIFILHANKKGTPMYADWDTTMASQAMCISTGDKKKIERYDYLAGFTIQNDPIKNSDEIESYSNQNFVVRTRIDIYASSDATKKKSCRSEERTNAALSSKAGIISTDYPPTESYQLNADFKVYLDEANCYTVVAKKSA